MIFNHFFEICLREKLSDKLQDKVYAQKMYAALCNQSWAYVPLAPRDYLGYLREQNKRQDALTNSLWRVVARKVLGSIRSVTVKIGQRRKFDKTPQGYRILSTTYVPILGAIDRLIMRISTNPILFPFIPTPNWVYECSWRYAGGLIADLRNMMESNNEDYMTFYCSGSFGGTPEGVVDEEIEQDLNDIGWHLIPEEV
jgi:hypothetical protein